jgi:AraC-like DNA-binding protein
MMPRNWSTLAAVRSRQFAYWRAAICEAFLGVCSESDLRDGFAGTVTLWSLGELSLTRIDSQRQKLHRTEGGIARWPRAGYYATFQVRGTGTIRQGGRVAVLRPGDVAVVDTDQPYSIEFGADFQQLALYIPRSLLDTQVAGQVRTAVRIDTATGVGAAIRHAILALARAPLAVESAALLAILTSGMLAVAMDPVIGAAPGERRATRSYRSALADIEEHLADADLSPAATARRLGISVRLLHALFAGRERTYAGTVRRMRLEVAWRNLRDPARAHLRVIDIAADAGFGDVTSFHRAFRREFGRTPARVRSSDPDPAPADSTPGPRRPGG